MIRRVKFYEDKKFKCPQCKKYSKFEPCGKNRTQCTNCLATVKQHEIK